MTTGTITNDYRTFVSTSCGDHSRYGRFFERVWTGVDGLRSDDHPYSMVTSSADDTLLQWSSPAVSPDVFTGTPEACGFVPTWLFGSYPSDHESRVVNRLADKVRGHNFNAAVNIGELKESVRMVGGTARTLATSFVRLKRRDFRGALKALGVDANRTQVLKVQSDARFGAGNAWLGMQYGWLPLIGAARDAAEACGSRLRPRTATFKTIMKASEGEVFGTGGNFSATGFANRSYQMLWRISEQEQFTTLEEFGFLEPELVAWELMPYSFVVDWFIPIGNFLQARSVLNKLEGRFVRSERWRARAWIGTSPNHDILSGTSFRSITQLVRTVGEISSMPLAAPLPKDPFSLNHMLSGLALLQMAFRSVAFR